MQLDTGSELPLLGYEQLVFRSSPALYDRTRLLIVLDLPSAWIGIAPRYEIPAIAEYSVGKAGCRSAEPP